MNIATGALAASLFAGIVAIAAPAEAQVLPAGSYLNNCGNVTLQGDALMATCRRGDGRETHTVLNGVRRCVGDISARNGVLQCAFPDGAQVRGQVIAEPDRGAPSPGFGDRRNATEGYGSGGSERCYELRREAGALRARLDREWNPLERARMEGHLRELHEQQERCPY